MSIGDHDPKSFEHLPVSTDGKGRPIPVSAPAAVPTPEQLDGLLRELDDQAYTAYLHGDRSLERLLSRAAMVIRNGRVR